VNEPSLTRDLVGFVYLYIYLFMLYTTVSDYKVSNDKSVSGLRIRIYSKGLKRTNKSSVDGLQGEI